MGEPMKQRILVVDDEHDSRAGLTLLLSSLGYEVEGVADGEAALERASSFRPQVVITDLVMPGLDGLDLLKALGSAAPSAAVIMLTGHASIETAVQAVRDGAYDYLTKPVDPQRLQVLLEKAIEKAEMAREVAILRKQVKGTRGLGPLLGTSAAMQEVYRLIELAAPTPAAVLISGETGTGKELVARTIHERSPRSRQPFVPVNCSAIPETLLESELFGHEKGAFTGAAERRAGYFELADAGTIFLDEITEMSASLQAKYLRVLQDGNVRRLGGKTELKTDLRVVAATNKNPLDAVKSGSFREDLYYRLNVMSIVMPPLRDRRDDIPLLVEAFINEFNAKYDKAVRGIDEASLGFLTGHSWPGNVRELRNTVERAMVACDGPVITVKALPNATGVEPRPAMDVPDDPDAIVLHLGTTLEDAEREVLLRTLASTSNNKTRAAEILGCTPKTLHNKLQRYAARSGSGV